MAIHVSGAAAPGLPAELSLELAGKAEPLARSESIISLSIEKLLKAVDRGATLLDALPFLLCRIGQPFLFPGRLFQKMMPTFGSSWKK